MIFPTVTALYGALLALLFMALSLWVVIGRVKLRVHHGDGGEDQLNRRIRAQGNFAEYVPFILLLAALLETSGAGRTTIHGLLAPLLVARIAHPVGMLAPVASVQQFALRGASTVITFLALAVAAIMLLVRLLCPNWVG